MFQCSRCQGLSKYVPGRLQVDPDGKETFWLGEISHFCQPWNAVTVPSNDANIAPSSAVSRSPKKVMSTQNLEDCHIFEDSYFHISKIEGSAKKIILFSSASKDLSYEFRCSSQNRYYCYLCKKTCGKRTVWISLMDRPDGTQCVKMNKNMEHKCEAVLYTPDL